ncbi:4Fe-4S binding protein [Candidatus Pacearchaeota archaeon]|nr:4Fe-4S binding protein [Candidatus Pacearchaeota archaeon]
MKPATRSKKLAITSSLLVGGFVLWWYFNPLPWLGAIMGVLSALLVFFILRTKRMEIIRRIFFISLFVLVLTTVIAVILDMGTDTFFTWVGEHEKEYYLPGQTVGILSYPCTREVPQVFLGKATYLPELYIWQTKFPGSLGEFSITIVPFIITGIIFGRGFCGWICPFGGLTEASVTGKKERWKLKVFQKQISTKSGFRYAGLKEWVKDIKYGLLLALILLSIAFAFPMVCIFCPVLWLESAIIFGVIISVLVIFAIVLPFMTKRRWWCIICPVGAFIALFNRISFFRIRINKDRCTKCLDCVQECRTYAMTPQAVERGECKSSDCIRCGRCIEGCPEEAADMYLRGSSIKARFLFISLAIVAAFAWYIWFVTILADMSVRGIGIG